MGVKMSKRGVIARIDKDLMEFRRKKAKENNVDMMDIDKELAKIGKNFKKTVKIKEIKF